MQRLEVSGAVRPIYESLRVKRLNHSCMYVKRGGVAAYHIVWIGLCLRSVPGVRVLASAVDDSVVHVLVLII